jgi:hypothetical protein
MEAVAEQAKASSTKKDTVRITVCKSLSGIAEGAEDGRLLPGPGRLPRLLQS